MFRIGFLASPCAATRHFSCPHARVEPRDAQSRQGGPLRFDIGGCAGALADVKPLGSGALDPVFVLVHKRQGVWNFVTMGGNLRGSGQQFKVPHALWKRWNL